MLNDDIERQIIGWREWGSLPDLGITALKMKVDTGAKTSSLHAFQIDRIRKHKQDWLRFSIHPFQRNQKKIITCDARLMDERCVMDSGGHQEQRYVIESRLCLGSGYEWNIELTLTARDNMRFRMLLGRKALRQQGFLVDSSQSYLLGKPEK